MPLLALKGGKGEKVEPILKNYIFKNQRGGGGLRAKLAVSEILGYKQAHRHSATFI